MLGGIGAGKSTVARLLARHAGAEVVDADALATEALEDAARDGRLGEAFGAESVRADGTPDREWLARRVFADPARLRRLEALVHPAVRAAVEERIRRHRAGGGPGLLVLDVPLLTETGLDRACDVLWFVEAPDDLRLERAAGRGLRPEEVRQRELRQTPLDRKRAYADLVIRNDRELEPQIRAGLRGLETRAGGK